MKKLHYANQLKSKFWGVFKVTFFAAYALFGVNIISGSLGYDFLGLGSLDLAINSSLFPTKTITKPLSGLPIQEPTFRYGVAIDTFQVIERTIKRNEFFAEILMSHHVDYPTIDQLVKNAKGVFNIHTMRYGKPYAIITKDSTQRPDYFVYEPSMYSYYIFDLRDSLQVKKVDRPVTSEVRVAEGQIKSSLWEAMVGEGLDFDLAVKMEDALQWSIDFNHVQKGDAFKLVYEQNFINEKQAGIGQVKAAYYKNLDNEYYAIYYQGEQEGYFDLEGKPMKKAFLKAPVKAYRISSKYNLRRFHPILKRTRPHYGTDYAAPYGTEIYAVGDGVITRAGYTKGNGNFVKIKHDDTYATQYLHMQKFASGISVGVHVKQGQVIGYVGSTGLATGPHVCFRFWKNNKQINHLKLTFPSLAPLDQKDIPGFNEVRDEYLEMMGFDIEATVSKLLAKPVDYKEKGDGNGALGTPAT